MERPSAGAESVTERVRELCLALPEVTERPSHGEATFFVQGKKSFAMMADRHHDDRVALWLAAGDGVQGALVSKDPGRYFRPPYVGGRGWVGAYLDGSGAAAPDWEELSDLLGDAWALVAPPRLRSLLRE